jgi:hypothetical protein
MCRSECTLREKLIVTRVFNPCEWRMNEKDLMFGRSQHGLKTRATDEAREPC